MQSWKRVGLVLIGASVFGVAGVGIWSVAAAGDEPVLTQSRSLEEGESMDAPSGMSLAPMDSGSLPDGYLSAEEASKRAWEEEGAPGDPREAVATLASFSWGKDLADVPVWVITYPDACVPQHGAFGAENAECLAIPFNVVVDAQTGAYVTSYAVSEGGYETAPIA